jgi:hypothetical protein
MIVGFTYAVLGSIISATVNEQTNKIGRRLGSSILFLTDEVVKNTLSLLFVTGGQMTSTRLWEVKT